MDFLVSHGAVLHPARHNQKFALVEIDGALRIASRTVLLDQSMILSKNLNVFF